MGKTGIGFVPHAGLVALALPNGYLPKGIEIPTDKMKDTHREDYIREGKEMIVAAVGDGVDFVSLGDRVLVASHGRLQKVEIEEADDPYYIIRQSDILIKFD